MSWWSKLFKKEDSSMKYLIVGLGNIGEEYENTRHNIGFKVVEEIASSTDAEWQASNFGRMAKFKHRGRQIYLLQPDTFMNLSGKAVQFWLKKLDISKDRLLIVTDDLNLPLGKIRIKTKGGNGGHNGMKSLEAELHSAEYPRMRIGIGNKFAQGKQVDFVLGNWEESELPTINAVIKGAAKAALQFTHLKTNLLMTDVNGKLFKASPDAKAE